MQTAAEEMYAAKMKRRADKWVMNMMALESMVMTPDAEGLVVKDIRVQFPSATGGDYRAIVRATWGGDNVVAFHSGESPEGCIEGCIDRLVKGGLKWREDRPYEQQNGKE